MPLEQLQRVTRLLLGLVDVAGAQMDLGERRHGLRGVRVAAGVERDPERLLQQVDRLVGLAEEEVQAAEVVRELADVNLVGRAPRTRRAPSRRSCARAPSGLRGRRRATPGSTRRRSCAGRSRPRRAGARARCPRARPRSRAGGASSASATRGCSSEAGRTGGPSARRARAPRSAARAPSATLFSW